MGKAIARTFADVALWPPSLLHYYEERMGKLPTNKERVKVLYYTYNIKELHVHRKKHVGTYDAINSGCCTSSTQNFGDSDDHKPA